jgi:HK97 gp10 family phage protein
MQVEFHVESDYIASRLRRLNYNLARQQMIKILKKSAAPLVKEIRKNAPVGKTSRIKLKDGNISIHNAGTLKKSIGIITKNKNKQNAQVKITARTGKNRKYNAWYRHYVEHGTKKWAGKPFILSSAMRKKNEFIAEIEKNIDLVLAKYDR